LPRENQFYSQWVKFHFISSFFIYTFCSVVFQLAKATKQSLARSNFLLLTT